MSRPPRRRPFALAWLAGPALLLAACGPTPSGTDPGPIDVALAPEQTTIESPAPIVTRDGRWTFTITPLASYTLRGVVLSEESYRLDWDSDLAPCDLAMAWGELAADDGWRRLSWSQSGRWYHWSWSGASPFPLETVVRCSSNTHIVPASGNLKRAARSLSPGDLAELSGELVEIVATKGTERMTWRSSLSRTDTGAGSCELLYLRRLRTGGKVYE